MDHHKSKTEPTICLNMIVKNESKIIERLLDSVINLIDSYCICDTGSRDDTIIIITNYFKKRNINGKIIQEPFKNFSHNRNIALQECIGMSEYVLLLDADMLLKIGDNFNKSELTSDYYYIFQGSDSFYYQNVRIIKNNGLYKYCSATHEYINIPSTSIEGAIFNKNKLFIQDIGDGGSKSNKFKRDIKLLEKGIKDEKDNARYYFYLANSYRDIGNYDKAKTTYLQLLQMNGWIQEKYCSCISLGNIYKHKKEYNTATKYWLNAIDYDNDRIEGVVNAVEYYRINEQHLLVNLLYNKFKTINVN